MNISHGAFVLASLAVLTTSASAERIFAVDSKAILVSFDSESPNALTSMSVIRGLRPGESIVGIDFRPANRKLYAFSSTGRIYTLDTATGLATAVGGGPVTGNLTGSRFCFNFNPTVDRIRITTNTGQNLRAHPDTGALVAFDGNLNYLDGATPNVIACAYTNSVVGATSTTLYAFELSRRSLVIQNPPNDGNLTGYLNIAGDFSDLTAFDISPVANKGYVATREIASGKVQLYAVDFMTAQSRLVGPIASLDQITALAVEPPPASMP